MALPPPPPPPSGRRFNRRIHSPGNEKTPQPRPEIRYRHRRREEGRSLVHTKKIAFTIRAKARERKEWEEGGGAGCFGGGGLVPLVLSLFLSVHLFGSRCAVADVCCCCLERGGRATRGEVSRTVHGRGGEGGLLLLSLCTLEGRRGRGRIPILSAMTLAGLLLHPTSPLPKSVRGGEEEELLVLKTSIVFGGSACIFSYSVFKKSREEKGYFFTLYRNGKR